MKIRYIGKSSRGLSRPRAHALPSFLRGNSYKERWIRELHSRGLTFAITVLEVCGDVTDLNRAEISWIAKGRALGWPLTNLTDGGDGVHGRKYTPEQLEALHRRLRQRPYRPMSAEQRARISATKTGVPLTEEHRRAISRGRPGKPGRIVSQEWREQHSARMKGRIINDEQCRRLSEALKRSWQRRREAAIGH
jgi:hypothetical protein